MRISEIIFFFCVLIITSCAASRKSAVKGKNKDEGNAIALLTSVIEQNVSNSGFFIEKGKITSTSKEGKISLFFNMKYSEDGTYLVSLRSTTGLEAFRVYLDRDTVMINDRLNKTLLVGNQYSFESISGVPYELLVLVTGDFYPGKALSGADTQCIEGKKSYSGYLRGLILNYEIDCILGKVKRLELGSDVEGQGIYFSYDGFRGSNKRVPRKVEIIDQSRSVRIQVKIEKISQPWFGKIEFVPGRDYDIRLLQ